MRNEVAGSVDDPSTTGGANDADKNRCDVTQVRVDCGLRAHDRVPRQRKCRHEREQTILEALPNIVFDEQGQACSQQTRDQVPGVDQWRRHFVDEHVTDDTAADATSIRQYDDANRREVPVMIGLPSQKRAIKCVGCRSDKVDVAERAKCEKSELTKNKRSHNVTLTLSYHDVPAAAVRWKYARSSTVIKNCIRK